MNRERRRKYKRGNNSKDNGKENRNENGGPGRRGGKRQNRDGEIVTSTGFRFTPPSGLLDDWDFLSGLARLMGAKSDESAMAEYFQMSETLLGPDGLERLKAHVRKLTGSHSFTQMKDEINELISGLKELEGN